MEICSFCGNFKKDVPLFRGNNAFICKHCVDRFSRKVVDISKFRKTDGDIKAIYLCPSCGTPHQPTLCPQCHFQWNPEDMEKNLHRTIISDNIHRWASQQFKDRKYFISIDFDVIKPGGCYVNLTLPLSSKNPLIEDSLKEVMNFNPQGGDSINIRYDDLFFMR